MKRPTTGIFVLILLFVAGTTSAWATLYPPDIQPTAPQAGDSVTIAVEGGAQNTCYQLIGPDFSQAGDTFYIHIQNYMDGFACFHLWTPFSYEFNLGVLDPGTYYYEAWETVGDSHSGSFTVADCDPCIGGDLNGSTDINISDLTSLVGFLFSGGTVACPGAADIDGSGAVDISDLTYFVDFLMRGGPPPAACR